ncbi:hypothetical protein FQA39_LY15447 [Lamprigera yunnana]|nr:hypothetical protein FQA39_LY15447 [Lamprigera yunnana]
MDETNDFLINDILSHGTYFKNFYISGLFTSFTKMIDNKLVRYRSMQLPNVTNNANDIHRYARKEEYDSVSVLSGAVRRRDVYDSNQKTHALLFFQLDSSLCAHFLHGAIGFYATTRLRREAHIRYTLIKSVFLQWLPWILGMSRPGKKITRKTILMNSRMKELELKERSSKSLLANVLDIDDDFRNVSGGGNSASVTTSLGAGFMRHPTTIEEASIPSSGTQRDLQLILRELQFITARMKKADEEAEVISDWKFAAMVVDRFCLIIFTMFTIIATVAVLLSAPHIIVQ